MSEADDIDALAGEYVLGTLDASERAEVAARRFREPSLDEAIRFWEEQLARLNAATADVEPGPATWPAILAKLDGPGIAPHGLEPQNIHETPFLDLTRRLNRWRSAALLSGALAAALAIGLIWRETTARAPDGNLVAVLQRDAASPAFIVEVNLRTRVMTVRPVSAEPQPGKSYELWLIHDRLDAPKSLGVVADHGFTVRPLLTSFDRSVVENGLYAITLEPAGGSPSGKPTTAPLWTGKLIQASP